MSFQQTCDAAPSTDTWRFDLGVHANATSTATIMMIEAQARVMDFSSPCHPAGWGSDGILGAPAPRLPPCTCARAPDGSLRATGPVNWTKVEPSRADEHGGPG